VIGVALKTTLKKQDWEFVFTTLHFHIGPMTILVLHRAVPHILQQNCAHVSAYAFAWYKKCHWRVIDADKSKHDANGSLFYMKSFVCVFMSVVLFKILSRTDICMKVIQARQTTLDAEVANINWTSKGFSWNAKQLASCVERSNYSCI